MVNETNPYTCLGLMPGNSEADIKRRYRQLAKQYHPDRNGHSADSEKKLRDLNAAYALLSDPARKFAYDASCAAASYPAFHQPALHQPAFHQPGRMPHPVSTMLYIPRRRRRSRPVAVSLILLLLLSTGVGVVFNAVNSSPVLSGFLMRFSGRPAGPERPPQPYSFLPSKGTFDDESSAPAPVSPTPGDNAQPQ